MKPIQVGDLVMIVSAGPNKSCNQHLGKIATVRAASSEHVNHWCLNPVTPAINGSELVWHSKRLKRIDPPATGDSLPTREELTA